MTLPTWTLIIIWGSHVYSGTSPAIEHVPGFKNQTACIAAGNAVLKKMAEGENTVLAKAVCVADR